MVLTPEREALFQQIVSGQPAPSQPLPQPLPQAPAPAGTQPKPALADPQREALFQSIVSQPVQVRQEQQPVQGSVDPRPEMGFFERVQEDFAARDKLKEEIDRATEEGEQTFAEGILQTTGKVDAGKILDFLGEVVISAGRGLSAVTPDFIEDPVREGAREAGLAFLETDIGKAGLDAAISGVEAYEQFAAENPRAARNIEAIVDIGLLIAPIKAKPGVPTQTTVVGRAAENLDARARAQTFKNKRELVTELISPKQTPSVAVEQVARTTERGLLGRKVIEPSFAEKEIIEEVLKLPVKKGSLQSNRNVIAKEIAREGNRLQTSLTKKDVFFPRREFDARLDRAIANLSDNPLLTGDAQKTAEKVVTNMRRFTDKNKSSASGLLKSRKELDNFLRSQKGTAAFDPARENAISIAVREVRNATNDFIDEKAVGAGVKRSLRKQSTLFRALDNIDPKAAIEGGTVISRAWQNAAKLVPLRGEFQQNLALTLGVTGLGAVGATVAPFITKLSLGGAGLYQGGKLLLSPAAKKGLSGLLKATDRALKVTKDKQLIRQMRLDRAAIVEILKQSEEVERKENE